VPEVVINIVSYSMVEQTSLASCEFPKGTNEFIKSGFTQINSQIVKPPRVGEAPVSFECKVNQVIPLGEQGGAGNLVVCEVLLMHIDDLILDSEGFIDPHKIDAVARMGQDYYCRSSGENVFVVPKPNVKIGIGFDQIPASVKNSRILSGNDLGRLGNIELLPAHKEIKSFQSAEVWQTAAAKGDEEIHRLAQSLLAQGNVADAWKTLL
jgi:hypothetical protein